MGGIDGSLSHAGFCIMDSLSVAIKIACKAHKSQTDKAGAPYILHPLRLIQRFSDEDAMIVAVLHDVMEDSDVGMDFLVSEGFKPIILTAVEALTKRENEPYTDFIERVSRNNLAIKVKIEDIKDNLDLTRLAHIDDSDLNRVKKYHQALHFLQNCDRH